jgi:asparagine synthase (glutamine-hydrolysing)
MCGICGIAVLDRGRPIDTGVLGRMQDAIRHRGPDDHGQYIADQVALGHRRLSIIDLATGRQPIANEDGTVQIVFNGEIYNYRELRQELLAKGHRFQSQSDTEVIVHLYEELGADCVTRLRGMFAFAIWDARSESLLLARDRVGIKPLYFTVAAGQLVFASEIKALLCHPNVKPQVEPRALDSFLMHGYTPGRHTAIAGVQRLLPGHVLIAKNGAIVIQQYWDLEFAATPIGGSEQEIAERLEALLEDAVREHMISDVPVGVLLSGGVDSTAMLSFAAEFSRRPIKTFTVGFSEPGVVDERPYARIAAERFGSQHHEMTITASDFAAFLPRYVRYMEEPVCEPPAVALYYVTELARQHVKVLLSGEGGDEGFAGYQNYRSLMWLERLKQARAFPAAALSAGMELLAAATGQARWRKFAHALRHTPADYYWSRTAGPFSPFARSSAMLYSNAFRREIAAAAPREFVHGLFSSAGRRSPLNQMLYVDTRTWLPDDLLIKADKMTMANSVELRVPLLDHRVLEFAAALPDAMKIKGWRTKHILKKALAHRVPAEIIERKKTGFPVPYSKWLAGELGEFVGDLLGDQRTRQRGYFEPAAVSDLLQRFRRGADLAAEVFSLVTLELWHREFIDAQDEPVFRPSLFPVDGAAAPSLPAASSAAFAARPSS